MDDHEVFVHNSQNDKPIGVTGHVLLCVPSRGLYLVGGWNSSYDDGSNSWDCSYVRQVWKYSFWSHKWTKLRSSDPPLPLASHSAFLLGPHKFVIFGGSLSPLSVNGIDNKCNIYNCELEQWSSLACSGSLISTSVDHWWGVNAVHDTRNDQIYVATGVAPLGQNKVLIHVFNIRTSTWDHLTGDTPVETLPMCRVRAQLLLRDNKLYLLGGSVVFCSEAYDMLNMPTFCLDSKTWSNTKIKECPINISPNPVSCFGCCTIDGDTVVVYGGYNSENIQENRHILWILDLVNMQWCTLGLNQVLPKLWFHQMVYNADDSCVYIFGGVVGDYNNGERETVLRRIRVKVPSLLILCLESVASYRGYSLGGKESLGKWMEAGLPKHILEKRLDF